MRKQEKPRNALGTDFEKTCEEQRISTNDAMMLLRAHKIFEKLNRSTLHRWCTTTGEIPQNATIALEIIKNTPKITASTEIVRGWIQKLQAHDETLRLLRKDTQEMIAQLTFHQN